jgi:hypothetical protein
VVVCFETLLKLVVPFTLDEFLACHDIFQVSAPRWVRFVCQQAALADHARVGVDGLVLVHEDAAPAVLGLVFHLVELLGALL